MRLFRLLPLGVAAALLVGVVGARLLPAELTLERALVIEAPRSAVFDHLARIRRWEGWYVAPGSARFEGPELGAGGALVVEDPEAREVRRLELVETSSPSAVAYRFPEKAQTPYDIEGRFELVEDGPERTRALSRQHLRSRAGVGSWLGVAGERWFLALLAERLVGPILERELHNLKAAAEGRPGPGTAAPRPGQ